MMGQNDSFNSEHRFGSARWADEAEIRRAGLFGEKGLPLGFSRNSLLRLHSDAPLITFGGAGSGKLRDLLAYVLCLCPAEPMLILDPRGELYAVSILGLAAAGTYCFAWDPLRLTGAPQHSCNPLDILKLDSPNFHADCKFIFEGLIPMPPGVSQPYFILRAREWVESIAKVCVEHWGYVSLPMLYQVINWIEGDGLKWADFLEVMLRSRFAEARRTASEMLTKQQDSQREFGSVMGEIYAYTSFLADPALSAALEGGDFSLKDLTRHNPITRIHLNVPAEYLGIWSPVIRIFFTVASLYKGRALEAPRVNFIIDEAGQLGRFEALKRSFTFDRGKGVRTWALFQAVSQIIENFEPSAVQTFLGSAQVRQFFGVRDFETAELVSKMLGDQTLEYDDLNYQQEARRYRMDAMRHAFSGGDPFEKAFEYQHYGKSAQRKTKQARPLMEPDEILNMPEHEQILFISGKNLHPLRVNKHPYYERKEMAGRFLPNPNHPPNDQVKVATSFGSKSVRVIEDTVPDKYAGFPQYAHGCVRRLESFPF